MKGLLFVGVGVFWIGKIFALIYLIKVPFANWKQNRNMKIASLK